jgi:dTDP-4-amino-4,6-dideoxygalactose transaminase
VTARRSTAALPALLGGEPAITLPQDDALRWPRIDADDEQAVLDVLRSGELGLHPETEALEADVREWLGVPHALAHNNGTAAIFAGLHALGIGPGDEVIVPSATWWSTVVPVLWLGAVPVFAECEPQQLGLDPDDVARRITERTRALVVVHLFGMPSRMDALLDVARRHGLRVFEDASHAHGARHRGRPIGTLGDAAAFSLQGSKLVPTAEGGVLVTSDADVHERALRIGHGLRLLHEPSPRRRFAATGFGFKFRMSPLSAALARGQLRKLPGRNAQRTAACVRLSRQLAALGLDPFLPPDGVERVYFEFLVRAAPAQTGLSLPQLVRALEAEGARVSAPRYPLLHQQPLFTEGRWKELARLPDGHAGASRVYAPDDLPWTTSGNGELLRLPTFQRAGVELLDQYATAFEKVLAGADEIRAADPAGGP